MRVSEQHSPSVKRQYGFTDNDSVNSSDKQLLVPGEDASQLQQRWEIAARIAEEVQMRYPTAVLAVGVHGALAHEDEREGSDIEIVILTYQPHTGPVSVSREISGWCVHVRVCGYEEYLAEANTLTEKWPLIADRYLHTRLIEDTRGCFARIRDAHLNRLASAQGAEFSHLARQEWVKAVSVQRRSVRATEWFDSDGGLLLLAEARLHAALVEGFLTRTYYRSTADATRRSGMSGANLDELSAVLKEQATKLAQRGFPVACTPSGLWE